MYFMLKRKRFTLAQINVLYKDIIGLLAKGLGHG